MMDTSPASSPAAGTLPGGGAVPQPPAAAQGRTDPAGSKALGARAARSAGDSVQLSPEAKALVAKLQARDADVRAHEQAHVAAGGGLITGGVSYSYEKGPDGRQYAVGGEVSIDTSAVAGNPRATLLKAQQIEAAAMAPADPSGQDQGVASQAAAMAARASAELAGGSGGQAQKGSFRPPGSLLDFSA